MTASSWITTWAGLVPAGVRVLDLAAGNGRHTRFFAGRGHPVTAVDRDVSGLAATDIVEVIQADLEDGSPWPLAGRTFGAVVVTNYLHRPLFPVLLDSIRPGGVLLYETFAHGNASVGKPSRPDFLLQPGELLDRVRPELRVVAYEDGFLDSPPRFLQRIAAVRQTSTVTACANDITAGTSSS